MRQTHYTPNSKETKKNYTKNYQYRVKRKRMNAKKTL